MQRRGPREGEERAAHRAGASAERGSSTGEGRDRAEQAGGSWAAQAASQADALFTSRGLPIRASQLVDERLARQVAKGSRRAFTTIYERYHQELYRYCYSLLRDRDDAYDALQSTLLAALAALRRGRRDAPLRPWLYRIAHNEAVSLIRRRRSVSEPGAMPEAWVPSAEDRAGQRARLALLVADLQALSERERNVLLMRELGGLSHREIAFALTLSVHTVKHAILAARRSLREFEEGRAMVCADVRTSVSDGHAAALRVRAHLRDCRTCAEFAAAIRTRRGDLRVMVPPLPPAAAAGLLAVLHGAPASTAVGAGGGAGASLAGKTTYALLSAKALAGVAVVAVTGASVAGAVALAKPFAEDGTPSRVAASVQHHRGSHTGARHSHRHRAGARASAGLPASASVRPGGEAAVSSAATASGTLAADGGALGPEGAAGSVREAGAGPSTASARRNGAGSANAGHGRGAEMRSVSGAAHGGPGGGRAGSMGHSHAPGTSSTAASEHAGGGGGTKSADLGGEHAHSPTPAHPTGGSEKPAVVPVPRVPAGPPAPAPPPAAIPEGEGATAATALPEPAPPTAQPAPSPTPSGG
jgi:RNA polymerase sigma factor (sigma-70 family)